jgi:molybdate transport system regulatory protein
MTLDTGFSPHLAVEDVTITDRDVEMLRAIDEEGSMHSAASALGRSYPHLQRRIVEIESAVGSLTRRARGGAGGGGTELTGDARALLRRFDRLRVALSGVTDIPESVIQGRVLDRSGALATVETAAGTIQARVPRSATTVDIAIRADAVVLIEAGLAATGQTSLQNQLSGVVSAVALEQTIATITLDLGEEATLRALVTAESVERLGVEEGLELVAAFKSTATRALATDG